LKRELDRAAVVVTRYFGGTKLGAGGLARAYGGAAARAIDAAGVRLVEDRERWRVRLPYGAVDGVVRAATDDAAVLGVTTGTTQGGRW
jgi:putative IMPACT (imprinted ancient) family translation regulator